jgi:hypothetical protein
LATAAAIGGFCPAAFFVGGGKQTATEIAQMKGQMVAVEQASIADKCNIQFRGEQPPGTWFADLTIPRCGEKIACGRPPALQCRTRNALCVIEIEARVRG